MNIAMIILLSLVAIVIGVAIGYQVAKTRICLLYTSDAADEEDSVDLGGRRIIKKKKKKKRIETQKNEIKER